MKRTPIDLSGVYEDDCCPDCGQDIPREADDGDGCENCGHVFFESRETLFIAVTPPESAFWLCQRGLLLFPVRGLV